MLLQADATAAGVRDLPFVTTKAGHIVALDAGSGATVWSRQFGAAGCGINNGGAACYTTSSPAVDPKRQYVYSYGLDGRVHKLQVADGAEIVSGGWPEVATVKGFDEKGSSALAIAAANGSTYLYVTHGGYPGDNGDYQGHVTAIDLATGAQNVFNAMCSDQAVHFDRSPAAPACSGRRSAIWARPGVIYDAGTNPHPHGDGQRQLQRQCGRARLERIDPRARSRRTRRRRSAARFLHARRISLARRGRRRSRKRGTRDPSRACRIERATPRVAGRKGWKAPPQRSRRPERSRGAGSRRRGDRGDRRATRRRRPASARDLDQSRGRQHVGIRDGVRIVGAQAGPGAGGVPVLQPQWQTNVGGTSAIVANNVLYYASSNALRAVDPAIGTVLWTSNAIGGVHWESPVVANGVVYMSDETGRLTAFAIPAPPLNAAVVEFYDASLDHYFVTSLQSEIQALDSGVFPGWARTGQTFNAYAGSAPGANPVCRFYLPAAYGNSHFYSGSAAECTAALAKYPFFVYESPALFYIFLPDQATGACPSGTAPVYRVWDARTDTNHRYTTSRAIRDQMVAAGWLAEGYGPDAVIMCAP